MIWDKTQSDLKRALVSKELGLKNMHKKIRDFESELEERIRVAGSGIDIQKKKKTKGNITENNPCMS